MPKRILKAIHHHSVRLRRVPLLPLFATLIAFMILVSLGSWQMNKYIKSDAYQPVIQVEGTLQAAPVINVGPRTHDGVRGYHIYGLLKNPQDKLFLLYFGWAEEPRQMLTFAGLSHAGYKYPLPKASYFAPDNAAAEGFWYHLDLEDIQKKYEIGAIEPFIVDAAGKIEGITAAPLGGAYLTPAKHLQYALFWYGMAVILMGMYYLRFVRYPHE